LYVDDASYLAQRDVVGVAGSVFGGNDKQQRLCLGIDLDTWRSLMARL